MSLGVMSIKITECHLKATCSILLGILFRQQPIQLMPYVAGEIESYIRCMPVDRSDGQKNKMQEAIHEVVVGVQLQTN